MSLANDMSLLSPQAGEFLKSEKQLFIGGKFQPARSRQTMPSVDPSSGLEIARFASAGVEDIDDAVKAARKAFETGPWPKMRPFEREALLLRLAALIENEVQSLAEIESIDSGRMIVNTRLFDAELSVHTLRYMAGWATKIQGRTMDLSVPYVPDLHFSGFTKRFPIGVIGAITPWNVPLGQAVWKIAPALATGCTIVLKPAEQTSLTALRLAELCVEAGVPDGVVNIVTGIGSVAGAALVEHPGIDKITFTGSTAVGKMIAQSAAPRFKPYNLELGGKSPVVIAEDADLDIAIPGAAWAIYGNHGQNCCAGSRLFIHESVFDRVVEGVAKIAETIRLGPGLHPETMMGPLVSQAHRNRVLGYVDSARSAGATILSGGEAIEGPGAYITPVIMTDLRHDHAAVQEEIFGPVVSAFRFSSTDEVIALANDTKFGLAASIWTTRLDTAHRFFDAFRAGTVWINTHNVLDFSIPFGGVKDSGVGHELGEEGLLAHTKLKVGIMREG
jgi:phenylacetaldehyde dehydrogenase